MKSNLNKEFGAALILSLVILLILTVLGITAMSTSLTQDILVRNLQDAMLNADCSETELKAIQFGLVEGNVTVNNGQQFDRNTTAGLQTIDTALTNTGCGNIVSGTIEYAGTTLKSIDGRCANTYEINLIVNSPTGAPISKIYALSLNRIPKCDS